MACSLIVCFSCFSRLEDAAANGEGVPALLKRFNKKSKDIEATPKPFLHQSLPLRAQLLALQAWEDAIESARAAARNLKSRPSLRCPVKALTRP